MFGRKNKPQQPAQEQEMEDVDLEEIPTPTSDGLEEILPDYERAPRASELMGGSGVSLDGRSLVLPNQNDIADDVSSINTGYTGFRGEQMRIVGTAGEPADQEAQEVQLGSTPNAGRPRSSPSSSSPYSPKSGLSGSSPASKSTGKTSKSMESEYEGCFPRWIVEAPGWLKMVIVLSTALLVGAIVLIGVGAALAVQSSKATAPADPPTTSDLPFFPPISAPTKAPKETPAPGKPNKPDANVPANPPAVATDAPAPTAPPVNQTASPTVASTPPPTPSPTAASTSTVATFYVTGGRFTGDDLVALPSQLASLPYIDPDVVMFHLGDWNSPFATSCVESSYADNVNLYANSAVPVYFVVGDNEFNDCPNPSQAMAFWYQYILGFETKFWAPTTSWNTTRQGPDYRENFSYVHNGLLVVAINLVGGVVHDSKEWQDRHAADLAWIDQQYIAHQGEFDMMAVLAHADPDIEANDDFFTTFYSKVQNDYAAHQVIFIHRNLGVETWGIEPTYNDIENLMVVVVEGSIWPPMLVEIDTKAGIIGIDQETWYLNYLGDTGSAVGDTNSTTIANVTNANTTNTTENDDQQ